MSKDVLFIIIYNGKIERGFSKMFFIWKFKAGNKCINVHTAHLLCKVQLIFMFIIMD